MVNLKDIYWLAGLLEGEGYFAAIPEKTKRASRVSIQLLMTDSDIVERAAKILDSSTYSPPRSYKPKYPNAKRVYRTAVRGSRALGWMMTLYSLMGERRKAKIRQVIEGVVNHKPMTYEELSVLGVEGKRKKAMERKASALATA